jgi:hypothetical protein
VFFECRVSFTLCFTGRNFRKYNFTKAKLWVLESIGRFCKNKYWKSVVFLRLCKKSIKQVMCFECRVSFALCFTGRDFRKYNFTKAKLWVFIGWGGKSIGKIIVFLRFGEKSIKKVMCF